MLRHSQTAYPYRSGLNLDPLCFSKQFKTIPPAAVVRAAAAHFKTRTNTLSSSSAEVATCKAPFLRPRALVARGVEAPRKQASHISRMAPSEAGGGLAAATSAAICALPAPPSIPEAPSGMEAEATLLEQFAEVPNLAKAVLRPAGGGRMWLTAHLSQRNLPANSMRKFAVHCVLEANGAPGPASPPIESPDCQLASVSPTGTQQVVFKVGNDTTSMTLQLWRGGRLAWEILVPKTLHGALVNDGYFASGIVWSPDEGAVAYVAEGPALERTPAWGGPESLKDAAGPKSWRGVGAAEEDWGELNTGKRSPRVYILDLVKKGVVKIPAFSADLSVGLPTWAPDGSGIVATVWPALSGTFPGIGRKLGVVFCYNRTAHLYHVAVQRNSELGLLTAPTATLLSFPLGSAFSASFSPDGAALVFLSQQEAVANGYHSATAQLFRLSWPQALDGTTAPEVVVDLVHVPGSTAAPSAADSADPSASSATDFTAGALPPSSIDPSDLSTSLQGQSPAALPGGATAGAVSGSLNVGQTSGSGSLTFAPPLDRPATPSLSEGGGRSNDVINDDLINVDDQSSLASLPDAQPVTAAAAPGKAADGVLAALAVVEDESLGLLAAGSQLDLGPTPSFLQDGSQRGMSFLEAGASAGAGATVVSAAESGPVTAAETVTGGIAVDTGARPFPGLYCSSLIDDCFIGPTTLLLTSQWYGQTAILAVDITGQEPIRPVTPVDGPAGSRACWSLLATGGGLAVAQRVAPDSPPRLYVARLPLFDPSFREPGAHSLPGQLQWQPVAAVTPSELPIPVAEALENLEYTVLESAATGGSSKQDTFETLAWFPRNRTGPLPTLVVPHGGPHTAVTLGWYLPYAYLSALGYLVISPNYRGSTGYGQAALASLPGNVGTNDVGDCMRSLQTAVDAGLADPARVAIIGGSHGGFLTAHLMGQHPSAFKAGILRNPVCNLSLMVGLSDIPDWCFVEAFGCEEGKRRASSAPTPSTLQRLFEVSPIAHVGKVQAPMLFMLGAKDRRVPLADGQQYIAALKAHGHAPRLITFPEDTHALDKPQTEFEQWLNCAWWLREHGMAPPTHQKSV